MKITLDINDQLLADAKALVSLLRLVTSTRKAGQVGRSSAPSSAAGRNRKKPCIHHPCHVRLTRLLVEVGRRPTGHDLRLCRDEILARKGGVHCGALFHPVSQAK